MRTWVRPLRTVLGAAAALAIAAVLLTRYGVVFIGGWSMSPALTPGDVAVYARAPVYAQERDVVLVAALGRRPFVHRVVVRQVDGSLRTRGDACAVADPVPCRPEDLGGLVTCVVPTGRALHALVGAVRWCYNHVPIADTRR
jgi:signal peptidase I